MSQPDPWHPVDPRPKACGSAACVQVCYVAGCVQITDSKLGPASPIQRWTPDEWRGLVAVVKDHGPIAEGVWISPYKTHAIDVAYEFEDPPRVQLCYDSLHHEPLYFSFEEWNAFVADVVARRYDDLLPSGAGEGAEGGADAAAGGAAVSAAATGADGGRPPAPVAANRPLAETAPGKRFGPEGARTADGSGLRPGQAGPSPVKPEPMSARHGQDPDSMSYTGVEEGESCLPETALTSDNITVPLGTDCVFPGVSGPASPVRPGVEATGTGPHINTPIRGPVPVAAEDDREVDW